MRRDLDHQEGAQAAPGELCAVKAPEGTGRPRQATAKAAGGSDCVFISLFTPRLVWRGFGVRLGIPTSFRKPLQAVKGFRAGQGPAGSVPNSVSGLAELPDVRGPVSGPDACAQTHGRAAGPRAPSRVRRNARSPHSRRRRGARARPAQGLVEHPSETPGPPHPPPPGKTQKFPNSLIWKSVTHLSYLGDRRGAVRCGAFWLFNKHPAERTKLTSATCHEPTGRLPELPGTRGELPANEDRARPSRTVRPANKDRGPRH